MTNRDRLIEALRGTAPNAVYRGVIWEQINCPYAYKGALGFCDKDYEEYRRNPAETCIKCKEDWLSQELDYELEGIENANI